MVEDQQVRRLMMELAKGKPLVTAAAMAGMDRKTGRKYRDSGELPSGRSGCRDWRTRRDAFADVWPDLEKMLEVSPGLRADTLLAYLQRERPGEFGDGQLRTLQRRVKYWRATRGPSREVYFAQVHRPGELCASDFTDCGQLGVRLAGHRFEHLLYHFVLTCSNWESVTICFSESFEALSDGLQNALWQLGGVPVSHRTDRLSAAVEHDLGKERGGFTDRYAGLLRHYGLSGQKIQPARGNENGDVEQSHHRLKSAIEQALLLRGSRDFAYRSEYEAFLGQVVAQRNAGRRVRFAEERRVLKPLPALRLDSIKVGHVRVGPSSTVQVGHNTYSVPSRLIGEKVEVRVGADQFSVWYGGLCIEPSIPRLRGEKRHAINYRHVIDWLVRKPGAFENYRWREDLFPTSRFRVAWDSLNQPASPRAAKQYLRILELAAGSGEVLVDEALRRLIDRDELITFDAVETLVRREEVLEVPRDVEVAQIDLLHYDDLLCGAESAA